MKVICLFQKYDVRDMPQLRNGAMQSFVFHNCCLPSGVLSILYVQLINYSRTLISHARIYPCYTPRPPCVLSPHPLDCDDYIFIMRSIYVVMTGSTLFTAESVVSFSLHHSLLLGFN